MKYISRNSNPSGAYPAPQSNQAPGMIPLTEDQAAMVLAYNGFVVIREIVEGEGGVTASVTPNTESWEAWKASLPEPTDPAPTVEDRMAALEAENKLLTAQVAAQSDQLDFYEDCIAEMASIVYA